MTSRRRMWFREPAVVSAVSADGFGGRQSEKEFQSRVVELLRLHGYASYHVFDSRRSEAGFPDLIAIRGQRLLAIELKVGRRRVTDDQARWLRLFDGVREVSALTLRGQPDGGDDLTAFENLIRRRGAA